MNRLILISRMLFDVQISEAWNKTHNAKKIAERFSVNTSTVYRLKKECGKPALWKHKSKGIQEFNIEKRVFMAYAHVIGLLGE